MKLRRKILISFIMLSIINGMVTLFVLQAAYVTGGNFVPGQQVILIAPGFFQVAASLGIGMLAVACILFLILSRLVLDPVDEIVSAAGLLAMGEATSLSTVNRNDEIGQLAAAFTRMAENVVGYRTHLEDKVKAAAEEIERTQRELAFTERLAATGRLAAGVAHEINNPLGGVMNAVARLRKEDLNPERREKYLNICNQGLKRIQETVRRILDFSRKRPEVGPVKATLPLFQSLDLIRHLLEPGKITLNVNINEDDSDPWHLLVLADAGDLQHVFLNLLMNAIDAMPDGGALTVNVSSALNWVRVEIIDTGTGLTPEELSASFDYFHTTKPIGKGTGLGLSISHYIVVGYKGTLTLNSRKGVGTKAMVELPAMGVSGAGEERSAGISASALREGGA